MGGRTHTITQVQSTERAPAADVPGEVPEPLNVLLVEPRGDEVVLRLEVALRAQRQRAAPADHFVLVVAPHRERADLAGEPDLWVGVVVGFGWVEWIV